MTRNQIDYLRHLETVRSNKANEGEAYRSNTAREFETRRANIANETETRRHNQHSEGLAYRTYLENVRHNVQSEGIQRLNAETAQFTAHETQRSNLAKEAETQRSNLAKEAETHRSNVAKEQETYRSNVARETETHRANVASESIGWANVSVAQRNAATREAELTEASRHNLFQEQELRRSNMVNESIRHQQIENEKVQLELNERDTATREKQADISQQQATTQYKRYLQDWILSIPKNNTNAVNSIANVIRAVGSFY